MVAPGGGFAERRFWLVYAVAVGVTGRLPHAPPNGLPVYRPALYGGEGIAVVGLDACCAGGTFDGTSNGAPTAGDDAGYGTLAAPFG